MTHPIRQALENELCACSQWVIDYGHDLKRGEHHHRECKKWHRVLGEAIVTKTEFMVLGDPHGDEDHNCDAMGCSSVSHVLVRMPLSHLESEEAKDAARWRHASRSRNHGITDWNQFGQRTVYDGLADEIIDRSRAALSNTQVEGGGV